MIEITKVEILDLLRDIKHEYKQRILEADLSPRNEAHVRDLEKKEQAVDEAINLLTYYALFEDGGNRFAYLLLTT